MDIPARAKLAGWALIPKQNNTHNALREAGLLRMKDRVWLRGIHLVSGPEELDGTQFRLWTLTELYSTEDVYSKLPVVHLANTKLVCRGGVIPLNNLDPFAHFVDITTRPTK